MKIALLPGDGIGPDIVAEAAKILDHLRREGLPIETEAAPIGGAGYDAARHPLPDATLALAKSADAIKPLGLFYLRRQVFADPIVILNNRNFYRHS